MVKQVEQTVSFYEHSSICTFDVKLVSSMVQGHTPLWLKQTTHYESKCQVAKKIQD